MNQGFFMSEHNRVDVVGIWHRVSDAKYRTALVANMKEVRLSWFDAAWSRHDERKHSVGSEYALTPSVFYKEP